METKKISKVLWAIAIALSCLAVIIANDWVSKVLWVITFVTACIVATISLKVWPESETLYKETKSQQVLTAIPGTCTAWGIFFTFFSIVVALLLLYFRGDGSDFSIFNIAGSIIPAFITSVIGMGFSIHYSKKITKTIAEEEKEEMSASGNPMLHMKGMAGDIKLMRQHNVSKEDFSTLITSIKEAIDQLCDIQVDMKDSLCSRLDSQEQKVAIIDQYIRNQDNILEKFANTFSNRLDQYFETSHADFEKQMKEHMTAEMTRSTDVLQLANQQMTENVKTLTTEHKDALENVVTDMKTSISETTSSIISSMENTTQQLMALATGIQNSSIQALETMNRETEFISNRVGQICTMYQQAQQGYTDTITNIHDQNEQWEKALTQGNESLLSIRTTQENINNLVAEIGEQNEMLNRLRSGFNDIQKTIEQLQAMNSLLTKITSRL